MATRDLRVLTLAALLLGGLAMPPTSAQTSVTAQRSPACLPSASRARDACEPDKLVVRSETELSVTLELPPVTTAQCAATVELEYSQRDTLVDVEGTLDHKTCAASSGELRLEVRIRDANGESKTLAFVESWRRDDDQPVRFSGAYPIGTDVDLVNVRSRQLRCTCAETESLDAAE